MISKNLSSVKQSKRLSMIIVSILSAMLYYPIGTVVLLTYTLEMSRASGVSEANKLLYLAGEAHGYLGIHGFGWIVAAFMAIILAMEGFNYLNHPIAMDFYESLPIKKSDRFRYVYLTGFKIWIVPMLFNLCLAVLAAMPFKVVGRALLLDIFAAKILEVFMFLAVYGISILGIMLAGKLFTGILTTVFLFGFELVIKFIFWIFSGVYFTRSYQSDTFYSKLYTSPFYYYLRAVRAFPDVTQGEAAIVSDVDYIKVFIICCICNLAIAVIMAAVSLRLFCNRTREQAGKTIINKPVQAILKISIAVVCGLVVGVLLIVVFNMEGSGISILPEILLMIIAAFLMACFMQIIIASDVKAMFSKMWQTLLAVAIMTAVFACFKWDLLGYDSYVPKAESIRSYALYTQYGGDDSVIYYNMNQIDTSELPQEKTDDYYQNNMYLTDTQAITELAQASIEAEEAGEMDGYWTMVVYYRLKSGRNVIRMIDIPYTVNADLMNRVLGSAEYKNTTFQFVNPQAVEKNAVSSIDYVPVGSESIPVTGASINGLNEAYQKDLASFDFDLVNDHVLFGQVRVDIRFPQEGMQDGELSVYYSIYDSYENTIAYLENYGVSANQKLAANEISSIVITRGKWDEQNESYDEMSRTYEDPEKIKKILDAAIVSDLDTQWSKHNFDTDFDYEILIYGLPETDEEGNVIGKGKEYYSYYFLTDEVPDFVEKDLK